MIKFSKRSKRNTETNNSLLGLASPLSESSSASKPRPGPLLLRVSCPGPWEWLSGSSNSRLITRIPRTIAAGKRCASDRAAASLTRSPSGNHPPPTLSLFSFFFPFLLFLSLSLSSFFPETPRDFLHFYAVGFLKRWR